MEKIYIVEDDPLTRAVTKEIIKRAGYKICGESSSGEQLIIDLKKIKPDLIIMDIGLSGSLDGIDASKIVFDNYNIPIIFLSAKEDEASLLGAASTNPYIYLIKPPKERELLINIAISLQKRKLEQKLLKEQLEKSKLLSHFENSPELIIRIDIEERFLYVNPVIFRYSGQQPSYYTSKKITESELDEIIVSTIQEIMIEIFAKKKKLNLEKELPTLMGGRVIEISAQPEIGHNGTIDSIIFVFKDMTDQKLILNDMRHKNKKIIDSMSYSKQIQEAVIQNHIQNYFKHSFIFHKPKDIISGDFPWIFRQDNNVYAAAVDCTGHGIPGALMSLIMYLLLNEIMVKMKNSAPGEILDFLHTAVNKTLNQLNNESRDGADVALCKIDVSNNLLEFAGARRPLYHISENGEFNQIKGDRFPIGGTQYTDRSNFTTHAMPLNRNDRLFMFSDGYPDQFGGPEKIKFGLKRMRELLINNYHVSMDELVSILDGDLNKWKKHEKQIDDILVLGIEIDNYTSSDMK